MKFTSKDNLNSFTAKLKAWIKARKIKASDLDSGSATAGQVPTADGSGGVSYQTPSSMSYLTTPPNADNTDGIKIVVLSSEPATKYNGYLYIITST